MPIWIYPENIESIFLVGRQENDIDNSYYRIEIWRFMFENLTTTKRRCICMQKKIVEVIASLGRELTKTFTLENNIIGNNFIGRNT